MTSGAAPPGATARLLAADRGPRFAAWIGRPVGPGWVAAADLLGAGLPEALSDVGAARGAAHVAVAGSLLVEQYAQRVVPPVLAAAVTEARAVDPSLGHVRLEWRDARMGRVAVAGPVGDVADDATRVVSGLMEDHLAVVIDAVHRAAGTPTRVLRGAIAHAVTVTFVHLSWPDDDPARYLARAHDVLAAWDMADLVTAESVVVDAERWLYAERRSCCLAFRTADHRARGSLYCATCPVTPEVERRRSFRDAVAAFRTRTRRS